MGQKIKRIGVITGGGDCSGLNAVLRGVVLTAINKYDCEVYGFKRGYSGLFKNDYMKLDEQSVHDIFKLGGTILKNSNKDNLFNYSYRDFDGDLHFRDVSDVAIDNIKNLRIDALVIIGGDGTLTSARDFARKGIKVIGIPKTIDNDVAFADITFGYTTALGVICESIDRLRTTAFSHDRVMILEVMGRHCGWLALEGGLSGGADVILLPEIPYDVHKIAQTIREREARGLKDTVIVISEGAKAVDGKISVKKEVIDSPDTVRLGGIGDQLGADLEAILRDKEVRVTNIGHIQRGGDTCQYDRSLCTKLGSLAVDGLLNGEFGKMVSIYEARPFYVPLEEVLGSGKVGETSLGGSNNVKADSYQLQVARNIGICFGD
jgi:6-phosphofructokinase 1